MRGHRHSGLFRHGPGFGFGTVLRILFRVFGLGFLVGGAVGMRNGVRAARRHDQDGSDPGSPQAPGPACSDLSSPAVRRRLHRAADALFGTDPEEGNTAEASDDPSNAGPVA